MTNAASKFGPVAESEYDGACESEKARLDEWLGKLPALSDEDFHVTAKGAIYDSAQVASWRGNWEATHCKATAVFSDAKRRHRAAGHAEDCTGPTLYGKAHSELMREHRYTPTADGTCRCDLGGAR